jgi:sporulation-control protein
MLKKLKAAMGAGAATVDAVLAVGAVRPGDNVTGVVRVEGGDIEQEIERITVALETVVEVESGDSEFRSNQTFGTQQVTGALAVAPGDAHEFPFSLPVPWETPLTHIGGQGLRGVTMGVRTELAVARGIDRGDLDPVQVHALPGQQALIEALEALGFGFKGADVEQGQLPGGSSLPFFQEIEFHAGGQYRGRFNELEVTFVGGPHETRVIFEADMRGGWFSEGRDAVQWFSIPTAGGRDIHGIVDQQLHALGTRRGWF